MKQAIKALIFDFDGVLANTEPLHFRAFERILSGEGIALSPDTYAERYVGLTDAECFKAVFMAHAKPLSAPVLRTLVQRKTLLMQEAIATEDVLIPGVADLVRCLVDLYRLAIASGALREEIRLALKLAGLLEAFEHIAAAQDVKKGKPAPDLYLLALHRLNMTSPIISSECLAIEDTPHGIQAAHAAGMRCLAVTTTLNAERLRLADEVTASLQKTDFSQILRRLSN